MFRVKGPPKTERPASLTVKPDKPVTARAVPLSKCQHKYKHLITANINEAVFFCEKCLDIKKKEL